MDRSGKIVKGGMGSARKVGMDFSSVFGGVEKKGGRRDLIGRCAYSLKGGVDETPAKRCPFDTGKKDKKQGTRRSPNIMRLKTQIEGEVQKETGGGMKGGGSP